MTVFGISEIKVDNKVMFSSGLCCDWQVAIKAGVFIVSMSTSHVMYLIICPSFVLDWPSRWPQDHCQTEWHEGEAHTHWARTETSKRGLYLCPKQEKNSRRREQKLIFSLFSAVGFLCIRPTNVSHSLSEMPGITPNVHRSPQSESILREREPRKEKQ